MKILGFFILVSVMMNSVTAHDAHRARFKMSSYLQQQVDQATQDPTKGVDVLIYLHSSGQNLAESEQLLTKQEKGQFVVSALKDVALSTQQGVIDYLDSVGASYRRFSVANVIHVRNLKPRDIFLLANRPDVKRVVGDPVFKAVKHTVSESAISLADEGKGIEEGVSYIKADKVWEQHNINGQDIVIAGQDTGVDFEHPAIKNQYRGNNNGEISHDYNWYDAIQEGFEEAGGSNPCGYASAVPCDDNGHGTHTIGTIVGDDGANNKIGVAPGAKWIACRNMDAGYGRPSSYLACFQFFLAPFPVNGDPIADGNPDMAPHVINNSWGCPSEEGCQGDEFVEVLANLKAAGIMVVVSAGNEGFSGCSSISTAPAHNSKDTLSVGALSARDGRIAFFSSLGPSAFDNEIGPDVSAPGVDVRSAVPRGLYAKYSGTSMAGPHVVGHVALMWSASEKLRGKVAETEDLVRKTAKPRTATRNCGDVPGSSHPNNVFGYGEVDSLKAVEASLAF